MIITAIIVEYNPFHNGHLYHLQKARELTNCDLLIAIMSTYFNQRGDISIIDKKEKCYQAIKHGVDMVIELPYYYSLSAADLFAKGAIKILKKLKVDYLVFGSETNNLINLKAIAELNINVNHLKELIKKGHSYPKAYSLLADSFYPNDILGIAYLKALMNTKIKALSIKRTNHYHSDKIAKISSASAIRKALAQKRDYTKALDYKITKPIFNDSLFNYLKFCLFNMSEKELSKIYLVSEGIHNHLLKNINKVDNLDDFLKLTTTRRYTKARLMRIIVNIIHNFTKSDFNYFQRLNIIRLLAFNDNARPYLKNNKIIIKKFKDLNEKYKTLAIKTASIYGLCANDQTIIKKELSAPYYFK